MLFLIQTCLASLSRECFKVCSSQERRIRLAVKLDFFFRIRGAKKQESEQPEIPWLVYCVRYFSLAQAQESSVQSRAGAPANRRKASADLSVAVVYPLGYPSPRAELCSESSSRRRGPWNRLTRGAATCSINYTRRLACIQYTSTVLP
jgi:hypothetical protein